MDYRKVKTSDLNLPKFRDIELPGSVSEVLNFLMSEKGDIYLVGGFIRDMVLLRKSKDLDFILVDKNAMEFCKEMGLRFEGTSILLDEVTGTTRFVLKDPLSVGYTFDFTTIPKGTLEADLTRRDFSINALAIYLKEPEVILDLSNGLKDLNQKKVKEIKLQNLLDDPLRMLRAFRFASEIDGEISKEVLSFIKDNIHAFNENISGERISNEIWKILDKDNSFKYIKQMSDIGILEKIFPELTNMRKVPPNDHHHLYLYDHSLELVETFQKNFSKIPFWAKEGLEKSFGLLDSPNEKAIVKLGCIFHDVGKPDTWEIKDINGTEKHTFIGHDKLGAEMVEAVGERLKFSNSIIKTLVGLVRHHLRPFQLSNNNAPITDRALYRFFRDLGDDTPRLLMLCLADLHATLGPKITKEDIERNEKLVLFLFDEYKKYSEREIEKASKPKLLDGNEVMKITGIKPSKELGELMKELDEAISVGEIKTKEEAIQWVTKKPC